MGGGDRAEIDPHRPCGSDGQHLRLLEHAEQRRLRRKRQIADLVEEERASSGCLDQALPVAIGAREGAAPVTEQLALDQLLGERTAVQRHERARAPGEPVERAGQNLFAGSGLASQEHRHARGGDGRPSRQHLGEARGERPQPARTGRELRGGKSALTGGRRPDAKAEERTPDLEQIAVGERRRLCLGAVEQRAVLGSKVGQAPLATVAELGVLPRHPAVVNADDDLAASLERGARPAALEDHAAQASQAIAGRSGARSRAFELEPEVRRRTFARRLRRAAQRECVPGRSHRPIVPPTTGRAQRWDSQLCAEGAFEGATGGATARPPC